MYRCTSSGEMPVYSILASNSRSAYREGPPGESGKPLTSGRGLLPGIRSGSGANAISSEGCSSIPSRNVCIVFWWGEEIGDGETASEV